MYYKLDFEIQSPNIKRKVKRYDVANILKCKIISKVSLHEGLYEFICMFIQIQFSNPTFVGVSFLIF